MQDKPIMEQKKESSKEHIVEETNKGEEVVQNQKPKVSRKDLNIEEKIISAKKEESSPLNVPAKKIENEEVAKGEQENPVSEGIPKSENEEVKIENKEPEEVSSVSSQEVIKKEEQPQAKKKVQYSKPNQMCVSKIKRVLKNKNGEISFCYDKQKFKNPDLEGSITVQINVHKSRNSIWVKKDTLKDKGFRSCMKSKIRDWDFGPDCYGASFKKSYKLVSG